MILKRKLWLGTAAVIAVVLLLLPHSKNDFKIKSRTLNERRTIFYHLPKQYKNSDKRYPVLFHLDALSRPTTFGPSFQKIAERVEDLTSEGIPEMIVFGIKNTNRSRDMLPARTTYHPQGGGAENFLSFIVKELIPYVEKRFRCSENRILYGRSDSGLFALFAFLENPKSFSSVIVSSPTIGFFPVLLKKKARELFSKNPHIDTHLYIIYGTDDIPSVKESVPGFVREFRDLKNPEFSLKVEIIPGGGHIPESSLFKGLHFVFRSGFNRPD
jgi:predicted alpha/beta superfamily hydrolase